MGFFPDTYTFSESDEEVVVRVMKVGDTIRPFTVRVLGGRTVHKCSIYTVGLSMQPAKVMYRCNMYFNCHFAPGPLPQEFVVLSGPEFNDIIQFDPVLGNAFVDVRQNITNDDIALEEDELFAVFLSSPSDPRVQLGGDNPATAEPVPAESTITIVDDDGRTLPETNACELRHC